MKYTSEEIFIKDKIGFLADFEFIGWLRKIGYFECPAAKGHHGANKGGLFEHSKCVAEQLVNLTEKLNLKWKRPESPWIVGLLHDICKTDDYDYDFFSTDNSIDYRKEKICAGHGDKSVIMLAGHIQLTEEEVMCIRFHMGAFTDKEEWQYYSRAVKKYPNVLYTHTADMIASQIMDC